MQVQGSVCWPHCHGIGLGDQQDIELALDHVFSLCENVQIARSSACVTAATNTSDLAEVDRWGGFRV
jgi:hypothetical protein